MDTVRSQSQSLLQNIISEVNQKMMMLQLSYKKNFADEMLYLIETFQSPQMILSCTNTHHEIFTRTNQDLCGQQKSPTPEKYAKNTYTKKLYSSLAFVVQHPWQNIILLQFLCWFRNRLIQFLLFSRRVNSTKNNQGLSLSHPLSLSHCLSPPFSLSFSESILNAKKTSK